MSVLEIILGIIAGIGGWEFIRYILDWIKKRKSTKKLDETEAIITTTTVSDKAISILNDTVDFQKSRIDQLEQEVKNLFREGEELRKMLNDNYTEMSNMRKQLDKICLRLECKNRVRVGDI